MRINIFNFGKKENWKEVESVLHQLWCMNQTKPIFPKCCDFDFKKQLKHIKQKYTYKEICEKLSL